ncbi:hypothetical protein [Mumia zhuanghuii]|uniref:Uncharacterized protein n=1 Tax=Mumia zhuanghuii TaxID=2585211 RepID=A0A5C4LUD7_9ACTN|nr:hypothetical protein [Mumia zhuanghuii]TNC21773.1 hypothetical protein FHE65_36320 [Mumia zhuanghuii]
MLKEGGQGSKWQWSCLDSLPLRDLLRVHMRRPLASGVDRTLPKGLRCFSKQQWTKLGLRGCGSPKTVTQERLHGRVHASELRPRPRPPEHGRPRKVHALLKPWVLKRPRRGGLPLARVAMMKHHVRQPLLADPHLLVR